jgi:Flp pilus assembly protein TadG
MKARDRAFIHPPAGRYGAGEEAMCRLAKRGVTSGSGQRGQAMVEFALVLPLLLIVLFLMVDFGVGFARWIAITNATREGARYGTVYTGNNPTVDITGKVIDTSNDVLTPGDVKVGYANVDGGDVGVGDSVVVRADYKYTLITPLGKFLTDLTFDSIDFCSYSDMRLEQVPDDTTAPAPGPCP